MSEERYGYSDDIESIVDMKDSTDGLGVELTTSDVVLRLNQLEDESEALAQLKHDSQRLLDAVVCSPVYHKVKDAYKDLKRSIEVLTAKG